MKNYFLILPIALLMAYSQIVVKWRSSHAAEQLASPNFARQLFNFLTDPVILSAYGAALLASFAWLFVITKLPLTSAFPIYIGVTFLMVLLGGAYFVSETLSPMKIAAVLMITAGIALAMSADA
ncbi:multidrug transporter EmrE-like cation transporter [Variovorax sp. TBS-050B]|uniref:hypothetical protein n=1 Tax=Variovorax sp. TBS-050B TaxID=2940551 RepID=UPI00247519F2|nr:hypothetical protein [Variovorax sp. TBS-050B]MDH6591651.1 multidrug transporter EmrE-like cation transporter [Variovorax sp. TBS-050B]